MVALAASVPAGINSLAELAAAEDTSVEELLEMDEVELSELMAELDLGVLSRKRVGKGWRAQSGGGGVGTVAGAGGGGGQPVAGTPSRLVSSPTLCPELKLLRKLHETGTLTDERY
jgi:hypothetical protein